MSLTHCRLCQNEEGSINLAENPDIWKKILECTKIDVSYPVTTEKTICVTCSLKIDAFLEFLDLVHRVDKRLKEEYRYVCLDCGEKCRDEETLQEHEKSHEVLNCLKCGLQFEDLEQRAVHCCDKGDESRSENDCSRDSSGSSIEEKKVEGSFICNICNENFPNKDEVALHKKSHTSFLCSWENCNIVCRSAYTLKTHEMKHAGKLPYLCVTCGKGFITKNSLNSHEKIHAEVKGYTCLVCNIGFSVRSNLRAHEKKHHEGVRFYCSQCTRAFITKCSLERHERLHTGIREFRCQSCPSAFYTNKELVKHQIYHQGLKQHKCEQCYKTFFEKHHLTIHLRSHSGEKPYTCKVPSCNKSFAESHKLTRHHKTKHPI